MTTNLEPHECVILAQSTKIGTHENKAIHSMHFCNITSKDMKPATFEILPGTWSHLWFTGVRECPPWCSIVGATVIVHQLFLYFTYHSYYNKQSKWSQ